jgi:tRNA pseudouridine13 synthase
MSDRPRIREHVDDFVVDEVPLYSPCGEGEHTFVRIEKRLRTTEEVVRMLARATGTRPRDIGYAGRKDRNAVTRQWFSVPGLDPRVAAELELRGADVLEAQRHRNKLRTGHLRANRFELVVRGVSEELRERARKRAGEISVRGMPNRFGIQRFGRDGDNAQRGGELLRGERVADAGDRRARRFLLSALQSAVFNDVLADRPTPIDAVEVGDVAMLHSSGGMFVVEDLARESERVGDFSISPTGPIFGTRMLAAEGVVGERERAIFQRWGLPELDALEAPKGIRLRGARRPLRAPTRGLVLQAQAGDALRIAVTLPPGSYATVLLEELLGDFDESPAPAVS